MHRTSILIKIQLDTTVRSLIYFTAKSLYMFRVPTAPIIRSTKNCNINLWYYGYYDLYRRLMLQFLVLLMMGVVDTRNM